jgi:hypothetical protein
MKRSWPSLLTLVLLWTAMLTPSASFVAQQPSLVRSEQPKEQTVYATRTGKKYHRDMPSSGKEPALNYAEGSEAAQVPPCKVCKPPK